MRSKSLYSPTQERLAVSNMMIRFVLATLLATSYLTIQSRPSTAQGYRPDEAAGQMTLPPDLEVSLIASEPMVRQPVAVEFDDRGRLWVIQYLQYPNPAGLKRVKVDRYSRTKYDRIPDPPPRGPRGADRITILEDENGDGRMDHAKDFVHGLNLTTGLAFGYGGVFVLQTPYLLFYPDRDGDDMPDQDPEVLVTGFGMEDAHSVANSLTWGPDGWLYGLQGSTVTANIRGIEFQQGVWRYHPRTKAFELFSEGGGNMWGLDFDPYGRLLASTNVGGNTVLHMVQGAYYRKSFGKHGALHNPFALGYFDHVPIKGARGGHVSVGGLVYQGDSLPERFHGAYIYGNLLSHDVYWHTLRPEGSSFRAGAVQDLLLSNDTWFAPTDVTTGPDGALYVSDWHDQRTAHPDPDASWDRSNGRIYRIAAKGTRPALGGADLEKSSARELVEMLDHPSVWHSSRARRLLAERKPKSVHAPLRAMLQSTNDQRLVLHGLWALNAAGGFDESIALQLLGNPIEHVRAWAVRLLGDNRRVPAAVASRLADLARNEPSVVVRSQLLQSARRIPAALGLPIVRSILARGIDANDPHIPMLSWWAIESHAMQDANRTIKLFASTDAWQSPMIRDVIIPRLVKRFIGDGSPEGDRAAVRLYRAAPSEQMRDRLLAEFEAGLDARQNDPTEKALGTLFGQFAVTSESERTEVPGLPKVTPELQTYLARLWSARPSDPLRLRIAALVGIEPATKRLVAMAVDPNVDAKTRIDLLATVGKIGYSSSMDDVLPIVGSKQSEAIQSAVVRTLGRFTDQRIADALLMQYGQVAPTVQSTIRQTLLGRKEWAHEFLQAADAGRFSTKDVPLDDVRLVALHGDEDLDRFVVKHWGALKAGTPEEKLAEMRRLNNDLRAAAGNAVAGRELFRKHCAICHKLFGEGNEIGPDLTHANRKDRTFLLNSIVDPSAVVRKEFLSFVLQTTDGRLVTGLIAEQTPTSVTILDAKNERRTIAKADVELLRESEVSLMPENQHKEWSPGQLRDLFAYLQSSKELSAKP